MKTMHCRIPALIILVAICTSQAWALDRSEYDELIQLMDRARLIEAEVFAPSTWTKVMSSFASAEKALAEEKKQETLDKYVQRAAEFGENAIKAAEVAKLSLKEYLPPRDKAREAKALTLVPEIYAKAEEVMIKATRKVESGDVKGALKEADKATPLFETAELEAIRAEYLGAADRLIEKALADDAGKYAPSTLDKARGARAKADKILVADRYDRGESLVEAARAEYEARHASNIGLSVRSLKRNDQAWEKLMLGYEIQMNRVGTAFDLENLPFHEGPTAAADELISQINSLQADLELRNQKLGQVSLQLRDALASSGTIPSEEDPLVLAETVSGRLTDLLSTKGNLSAQMEEERAKLAELTAEHQEVSGELAVRREREEKFRRAKDMLSPAEGEVLFNASNDIVMRLSGLSFDSGKSEVGEGHMPLLEKTKVVIQMFPDARIIVEGHTDAQGDAATNMQLSEKRAFAVMQYLRQSLLISTDHIQSMGYGAERPVASNQSDDGRAKNRRIDIVIMQ